MKEEAVPAPRHGTSDPRVSESFRISTPEGAEDTEWQPHPRPAPSIVEAFRGIPSTVVCDAMGRRNALASEIRPILTDFHLCGPAVTVSVVPGSLAGVVHAMEVVRPGDVLVIDAGGYTGAASFGGMLALLAQQRGLAGTVVDGAIRDVAEQRSARYPVFCRGVTPAGPPHRSVEDRVNHGIQCGGVPVLPGDLVVGDEDGVVVVPRASLEPVLERSRELLLREAEWINLIRSGRSPF
jgi:4-hydroxy-4-methyl-2-oxoglutarate aldolase